MSFSTQDITRQWASLPASQIAVGVNEALHTNSSLVVTAPPGAGKSTLLPLTILSSLGEGEKILMLEPRRLAARQIAERMAQMLGEQVGETIGYRVRFESRVSKRTRIEVLTEGILTRMIVDDATLDGVSVVIFDEFHERSINSDLALALTRQAQQIIRPDLKVVIMSATIDTSNICAALQAPLIESEGRMFPVELHYADEDTDPRDIAAAAASTTIEAYKKYEGDILVFLPGQAEIEQCYELLSKSQHFTASPSQPINTSTHQHLTTSTSQPTTTTPHHLTIHPLYGNLSPEDQRRAIAPSAPGERKIVIATPIAETSITIEGVRVVIDAGLCRQVVFDARTGLSHLETVRISMDMATQRMGRAGRVAEGVCYRLWTKASEHLMAEQRKPEIEEADLAPMLLDTAAFGESDAEALPWLTMPPRAGVFKAKELLTALGAIDENGNITSIGKRMATLPCHPRIARMILATTNLTTSTPQEVHLSPLGFCRLPEQEVHQQHLTTSTSHHNNTSLACDIAALLEEKDPLSETGGTDLTLRLSALRTARRKKQLGRWQRIAKIAAEYRRMAHTDEDNRDPAQTEVGLLVAYAYPERIAHSTNSIGGYRLASGANVQLDAADQQSAHSWLAIASLYSAPGTTGRVFLAAPIAPDDLEKEFVKEVDNIAWDTKQGCVVMQREQRIGKLILSQKPIHDADKERLKGIVCEAMKKDGLTMMAWSEKAVEQVQRRVAQVAAWHPEMALPDVSTEHLLSTAADWLPFYLEEGGRVKTSVQELRKLNLAEIIWNILPYEAQLEVDRLVPTHIEVPTGSHIRIDYRSGAEAPVLSVRLQECFGMERTPCVDDGRQPLLMELLSPGFKPVQLTQDLASFWQGTYFEVRKELRRRYPKHYWPENPLEAEAVRGVKRK
ncbi:MAG: ATP-dependent helicase C-terminal domain-containing protein [Prevotella stercorea]|uniref:ATP-dependent RNA helicase n=1 Tax=Leyella stercorea TaxID=363265 RepID=UPI002800F8F0|nr:ATP-dependent helicase C-terminal domain-containing protein [Leyella stercorea]MDY5553300.1 ATP-dependent helicase C-terminal domain-containing protein [Prevotella sp.]